MARGGGVSGGEPRFEEPVEPPPDGSPWTVLRLLRWSTAYLAEKGVPEARLDAEHLLADALQMDRLQLYLHFDRPVEPAELARFKPHLVDRARRRPLQYILGRTAFRELELTTDDRALIPRPETEELVGAVLEHTRKWGRGGLRALDVGTGSGAIALSLLKEGTFERVVATDSSSRALELARENAVALGLDTGVEFREGPDLVPVGEGEWFDVLVSNPPYVTRHEFSGLEPEVREWEPADALVAGEDGLAVIERIVSAAGAVLVPGGLFAMELGEVQGPAVLNLVRSAGGFVGPEVRRDLSRRERMVLATRSGGAGTASHPREGESERTATGETRGGMERISTKVRGDVQD